MSFVSEGARRTVTLAPSDTNVNELLPASTARMTLIGINIAAGGTGAAASVFLDDGSTEWPLLDAREIAPNDSEVFTFGHPVLDVGHSINVQTDDADELTFVITIAEELRRE